MLLNFIDNPNLPINFTAVFTLCKLFYHSSLCNTNLLLFQILSIAAKEW